YNGKDPNTNVSVLRILSYFNHKNLLLSFLCRLFQLKISPSYFLDVFFPGAGISMLHYLAAHGNWDLFEFLLPYYKSFHNPKHFVSVNREDKTSVFYYLARSLRLDLFLELSPYLIFNPDLLVLFKKTEDNDFKSN